MKFIFRSGLVMIIFLLSFDMVRGQISEAEIRIQEIFIEATKEMLLGNYDKAIAGFEEVLQKNPANDVASFELARAYEMMSRDDDAIRSAREAVRKNPSNLWYKLFLGDLYQKTDKNQEAAELYASLTKEYPGKEEFPLKWAFFLLRNNEPAKAIEVYEDLEKKNGINEELTRRKYSIYMGMGDYKKAGREIEKLIETFPGQNEYRHLLAGFYKQVGDQKNAEKVYKEILQRDPGDTDAKLALAGESKQDKTPGYLESLKKIFEDPRVNIDIKIKELIPFVERVAGTGDIQLANEALELSAILERIHPNEAKAFSVSGDLLYHSGQKEKAQEKYHRTLELDDTVYLVWEQYLTTLKELKDYETLLEKSEEALDVFPNQALIYYYNGYAKGEKSKHAEAISSLQQALFMTGKNGQLKFEVLTRIGKEYAAVKKFEAADNSFEQALELNPNDPFLLNEYSASLAERGVHLTKAKEMAALANELYPNYADFQHTYGWILYKMKEYKAAREWLDKAVQNSRENDPLILEHYGDILFNLNQVDQAVAFWQKALNIVDSSPSLERKIAERHLD